MVLSGTVVGNPRLVGVSVTSVVPCVVYLSRDVVVSGTRVAEGSVCPGVVSPGVPGVVAVYPSSVDVTTVVPGLAVVSASDGVVE